MSEDTLYWKTARELAEAKVADLLGSFTPETDGVVDAARAEAVVDMVFTILREPDRDMLEAGRREVVLRVAGTLSKRYERDLAAAVWRSMFAEAR